uniref:Methylosome subunit pICln n=1 Tax=Panagrellus redivivus TaxID=6233 RepID=A0A7E4UNR9_PANRE
MVSLQHLSAPVDQVFATQPNVVAFWESQNLQFGTLYLTAHTVTWINTSNAGFVLPYPAIAVHAASGASEQFPDPSLFLLVDVAKTDIQVAPSPTADDESDDDEVKTVSIRNLYGTMNRCQELNPDPKDELDSTDEEDEDDEHQEDAAHPAFQAFNGGGGDGGFGNQWYTAENVDNGVELNEEGLANLARMLGGTTGGNNANGAHQEDEPMDDA